MQRMHEVPRAQCVGGAGQQGFHISTVLCEGIRDACAPLVGMLSQLTRLSLSGHCQLATAAKASMHKFKFHLDVTGCPDGRAMA